MNEHKSLSQLSGEHVAPVARQNHWSAWMPNDKSQTTKRSAVLLGDAAGGYKTTAELIPAVKVGQVWRQRKIGGMWRTVVAIHPAGVEWTAKPDRNEMSRWETWDRWVRETEAEIAVNVE